MIELAINFRKYLSLYLKWVLVSTLGMTIGIFIVEILGESFLIVFGPLGYLLIFIIKLFLYAYLLAYFQWLILKNISNITFIQWFYSCLAFSIGVTIFAEFSIIVFFGCVLISLLHQGRILKEHFNNSKFLWISINIIGWVIGYILWSLNYENIGDTSLYYYYLKMTPSGSTPDWIYIFIFTINTIFSGVIANFFSALVVATLKQNKNKNNSSEALLNNQNCEEST